MLLWFQNFFCGSDQPDDAWVPYYKKFFNNIVHFTKLEATLHKGDFCINTSLLVPGHLIIRYHDAGVIRSLPLEGEDFPVMWRKDWCEKMRSEMKGRFLFLNCVVNTERGLERRPWRYLMSEFGNVSRKQFKGESMKILAIMQRLYSLCKMVSLGQKLKFQKTCRNRFYNHIKVVVCLICCSVTLFYLT